MYRCLRLEATPISWALQPCAPGEHLPCSPLRSFDSPPSLPLHHDQALLNAQCELGNSPSGHWVVSVSELKSGLRNIDSIVVVQSPAYLLWSKRTCLLFQMLWHKELVLGGSENSTRGFCSRSWVSLEIVQPHHFQICCWWPTRTLDLGASSIASSVHNLYLRSPKWPGMIKYLVWNCSKFKDVYVVPPILRDENDD